MKLPSLRRLACLACAGALSLVFAVAASALDVPKFSDPDVTAFAKAYAEFAQESVVAVKAAAAGDNSKAEALAAKAQAIQEKAATVSAKVKPEEAEKFQKFMLECVQLMTDAMK